jgi:uncharacterized LabA/DUF88 family protein
MEENNLCFIDGQNLYIGTKLEETPWNIDFKKLRKYLKKKYKIKKAYYYIGYKNNLNQDIYSKLKNYDYQIVFKNHISSMISKKKGNIDCDIIFDIMKKICEKEIFNKIILISGDGDYIKLVNYLIEKNKFEKILFPNKKYASSLYRKLGRKYFDYLYKIKSKLIRKQKPLEN